MKKAIVTLVLCAVAVSALGQVQTYVEYQGTGGNLGDSSQWYVITNKYDPSSHGLPPAPVNRLPAYDTDWGYVRNGTTSTLNSYIRSNRFFIGGEEIRDSSGNKVPQGASTVHVGTGGTIWCGVPTASQGQVRIGNAYDGNVYQSDGVVYSKRHIIVGGSPGTTGRYEISGGLLTTADGTMYFGRDGGTGIITQTGGTVRSPGADTGLGTLMIGSRGTTSYGEYNLVNGYMNFEQFSIGEPYEGLGGTGVFNQSGGSIKVRFGGVGDMSYGVVNLSGGTFESGFTVGQNFGTGHFNISGGTFLQTGTPWIALGNSTGVVTMTGGLWALNAAWRYDINVGQVGWGPGENVPGGFGHLRFLGGTARLTGTGIYLMSGRITLGQDLVDLTAGNLRLFGPTGDYSTSMEIILGDDRNFNAHFCKKGDKRYGFESLGADLLVTLKDGFKPTPGQEWRIFTADTYSGAFASIPAGYRVDIRGIGGSHETPYEFYLVYIPEPATMGLLALGALGMLRRRRS